MIKDPLSWMPIRYKLSASYVLICLLAFGVGGYLISVSARETLESEIKERLRWQAHAKATDLERSIDLIGRRAEDFSSDGYIRREAERAIGFEAPASRRETEESLERLALHLERNKLPLVSNFKGLRIHDMNGNILIGVTGGRPERSYGKVAVPRDAPLTAISFSGFTQEPDGARIFTVDAPLWSLDRSRRIGTLVAVVDARRWTRELLSRDGDLSSSSARDVKMTLKDGTGSGLDLTVGSDDSFTGATPSAGRDGAVAMRPEEWTRYSYTIPASGWILTVEQNARPSLAPVTALQSRFLAAGLVTVVATMALLFFPMRFLVNPLSRMQAAAKKLADGDFTARVEINSTDEVGDLATAFNFMAEAVRERTTRLEKSAADLARRKNELSIEKDRLRTVVQSMKDGLVLLDESGAIELSNAAASPIVEALSGRGERVGPRQCKSDPIRSMDCLACLTQAYGANQSCMIDIGASVFEIHATRLPSPRGQGGRVLVARDVTRFVTLDERQAHQERLAVLGEVSAVIAHEMNNPLAAISMFAQMMEREIPAEDAIRREYIGVIRRNTDVCKGTIRGLLDYAAGSEPDIEDFDLHELLREAAMFLSPLMKRARVDMRWELDAEAPLITGVETHMRHVFANLFINAVHAMQKSGGSIKVATRQTRDEDALIVEISDTGPGVPEAIRENIFDAFFSTKPTEFGTGLGLSTSRRIVESVGGLLTLVCGEPGKTTFRMILPRNAEQKGFSWRNLPQIMTEPENTTLEISRRSTGITA